MTAFSADKDFEARFGLALGLLLALGAFHFTTWLATGDVGLELIKRAQLTNNTPALVC